MVGAKNHGWGQKIIGWEMEIMSWESKTTNSENTKIPNNALNPKRTNLHHFRYFHQKNMGDIYPPCVDKNDHMGA